MIQILVSRTFQKQFKVIPLEYQKRIRNGLKELEADPYTPRSHADIKPLHETDPQKYRIRIGEYRVIYSIDGEIGKVIEIFRRNRGYRE